MIATPSETLRTKAQHFLDSDERYVAQQEYMTHPYGSPVQVFVGNYGLQGLHGVIRAVTEFRFRRAIERVEQLDTADIDLVAYAQALVVERTTALEPSVDVPLAVN